VEEGGVEDKEGMDEESEREKGEDG